jgi:hypothetical protein
MVLIVLSAIGTSAVLFVRVYQFSHMILRWLTKDRT